MIKISIHKLQKSNTCLSLSLPKEYTDILRWKKQDKVYIGLDVKNNRLIVKKMPEGMSKDE